MSNLNDEKYESFLKLYRANETFISRYVLALCPNFASAEDIMQETMLVMWRKFDHFIPGSNFIAWGMQIARINVFNHQRKQKAGIVHLDNTALENISQHGNYNESNQEVYLEALDQCAKQLSDKSRKMVSLRYVDNMKVTEIALKLEKTLDSTYKMMSRIHHVLLTCIEQKLAKGGIT